MSVFYVDSSSELTLEQTKMLGVERIEMPYSFDGNKVIMENDFDLTKFYSKLKKGIQVKNASMTTDDYIEAFEPILKQNDDIVYVHSSSGIISTDSLCEAKNKLLVDYPNRRIELIDSCSFSIGYGIIAYNLALKYRNGATIDELVEYADNIKKEYSIYLLLDNVETISSNNLLDNNNLVTSALSVKPIISTDIDGNFELTDKVSGRKKGVLELIKYIRETGENVADNPITILYSNNVTEAEDLKTKLNNLYGEDIKLFMQRLTPSNASIVGINVLGISFHTHRKIC